ncbi:LEM domain-containing protein 1 [Choloepus didactylus]|uniref:LEM domain-containing protein 1 n=1 Tax=Choloepus didactylus TaxID=27675 RepID=UPI00189E3936|nr:LEM domain-containing protein 1 [Choloepus didactylus]
MVDVRCLSDSELQEELQKLGFSPGPILPSTRKVYENKLVQLLVSTPCAPPATNGPRQADVPQDSDDSEELNTTIVLKGNIILSTEYDEAPKKNLVFEIQERQEVGKPNSDYNDSKMIKRSEAPNTRPKAPDSYCLDSKTSKEKRGAARASQPIIKEDSETADDDYCPLARVIRRRRLEGLPVALAMLGIFIIVVFVYITVEKKPLFG